MTFVPVRDKSLNVILKKPEISVVGNHREWDIGSILRPRNQGDWVTSPQFYENLSSRNAFERWLGNWTRSLTLLKGEAQSVLFKDPIRTAQWTLSMSVTKTDHLQNTHYTFRGQNVEFYNVILVGTWKPLGLKRLKSEGGYFEADVD